jgi:prevent-host-death family protein
MTTVTVHEAKTHLSRLIAEVLAGGEVVIAPRGKAPAVKIVPVDPPKPKKRVLGRLAHLVPPGKDILAHGFWDPLPEDELALWNCEGDDPNDKL